MVLPYNKSRDAELSVLLSSLLRRKPAIPPFSTTSHLLNSLLHHHGWTQDFVGADPLYFQPAAEAQHGFDLVVRAARLPY